MTLRNVLGTCSEVVSFTSTLRMTVTVDGTNVTGTAAWSGRADVASSTCGANRVGISFNPFGWGNFDPTVGGSTSNITFHHAPGPSDFPTTTGEGQIWDFTGALNGRTITGTADFTSLSNGVALGRVQIPVSLAKQ